MTHKQEYDGYGPASFENVLRSCWRGYILWALSILKSLSDDKMKLTRRNSRIMYNSQNVKKKTKKQTKQNKKNNKQTKKQQLRTYIPSADSDQPAGFRSPFRIFPYFFNNQGYKVSSCEQQILRPDFAGAQADLSLHWVHMSEGTFSHIIALHVFK